MTQNKHRISKKTANSGVRGEAKKNLVSSIPIHPSHLAMVHSVGELLYLEMGGPSATALVNLTNQRYEVYEVYSEVVELGITVIFCVYLGIPSWESTKFSSTL